MDKHDLTRRKFLRGFAAVSSAAFLMRFTTGCGSDVGGSPGGSPMYGPPALLVGTTKITGMYYLDASSNKVDLHDKTGVPVNSRFQILFSADMRKDTVFFVFAEGSNLVDYDITWIDARTAEIAPKASLKSNTKYNLLVTNGLDSSGKLLLNKDTATFTTA